MPTADNYITLQEFNMWLQHPITRIVCAARLRMANRLADEMGRGGTLDCDNLNSTALNTAVRVGYLRGLREAFEPPVEVLTQKAEAEGTAEPETEPEEDEDRENGDCWFALP